MVETTDVLRAALVIRMVPEEEELASGQ